MNPFPPEHTAVIIQWPRTDSQREMLARADWDLLFHAVTERLASLAAEADVALHPSMPGGPEGIRSALLECVGDLQQLDALRAEALARRTRIERVLSDLHATRMWARPPMPRAPSATEPA